MKRLFTKPSGIPWLGEVPAHWEVKRLRYLVEKIGSGKTPKGGAESYPFEGIIFIRSQNVYDDGLRLDDVVFIDKDMDEEMSSTRVRPNDVLLNITGASIGRSARVPDDLGPANVNQHVAIIRPSRSVLDQGFLHAFLCSQATKAAILADEVGSSREALNSDQISALTLPLPPIPEQRAIAAFLDERTARIDALVARKRRLVQLLKEKRQALITRAVTRGLDPKAKMKESGVPWLGEVPEGWEVKRLKYLLREPLQYGANEAAEQDEPDQPRFIRITDINEDGGLREETFRSLPEDVARPYLLEEGDVLFARSGATVGKTFLYTTAWGRAAYAGYLIRARLDERRALAKFIQWFTTSTVYWQWLESNTIQATIQNVSADKYNSLWVPVPPLDEQGVIVQTVQSQLSYIDALVTKVEQAMERLQEYRTALISAAVTGKVPPMRGASADKG